MMMISCKVRDWQQERRVGASESTALCAEYIHVGSWKRLRDIKSRCSPAGCGRGGVRCAGPGGPEV